jgi:hypothetical protein
LARVKSGYIEVNDYEAAYALAMEKGWGDGLPIVIPTPERVGRMLDYVGLDPDFCVGEIPAANGRATIEKLAINAVMAGCLPEYLPVVIAVVEAVLEPEFNLNGVAITTNPAAPMIVVNGPIRRQIDLNCRDGCLGPGWRANATIGRALRLILHTLGGDVPGPVSKALLSTPARYSFCFGEDEENSPWTPLHVDRGLPAGSSAVTVIAVDSVLFNCALPYFDKGTRFCEIAGIAFSNLGANDRNGAGQPSVILQATLARRLEEQGLSKKDFQQKLFDCSRIPEAECRDLPPYLAHGYPDKRRADGWVQPCETPDEMLLIVAGGELPAYAAVCPSFSDTKAVTKEIKYFPR